MGHRTNSLRQTAWVMALALGATSAHAQSLTGIWDMPREACAREVSDSRVKVSGSSIRFWESECALMNPTRLRDMPTALLYDMECSGEGETWSERVLLGTNGADGLVIYQRGYASLYHRCE